jgi:hypothetical protein
MRDQDQSDCRQIKQSLAAICAAAGHPEATVRIACRELEAFYLGDLHAVETGLNITGLAAHRNQAKFRDPDQVPFPARELETLTGNRYQKIAGSRAIAPHLNLETPRSKSFHHLQTEGTHRCIAICRYRSRSLLTKPLLSIGQPYRACR